jgi:hypothetical protein
VIAVAVNIDTWCLLQYGHVVSVIANDCYVLFCDQVRVKQLVDKRTGYISDMCKMLMSSVNMKFVRGDPEQKVQLQYKIIILIAYHFNG